jgi:streptogramin lyase
VPGATSNDDTLVTTEAATTVPMSESTSTASDDSGGSTVAADESSTGSVECPDLGILTDPPVESNIWLTSGGTDVVFKIDARTGDILARYVSGPGGFPSGSSVNLHGDVVVANRGGVGEGSITKIVNRREECLNGGQSTSMGAGLPWGEDDCVVWNTSIPSDETAHGPYVATWEGALEQGCPTTTPRAWTAWYDFPGSRGVVHRLDGATGEIEDTATVPDVTLENGPIAGAVDANGDFWVIFWQTGPLVRVDGVTFEPEILPFPDPPADSRWAYGLTIDAFGNPWVSSSGAFAVYDVASAQWDFVQTENMSILGIAADRKQRAYGAISETATGGCGLTMIDVERRAVLAQTLGIPGCVNPTGVSVDLDGHVWVVDDEANNAVKLDGDTLQVLLTFGSLSAPFDLSDNTSGAGLALVVAGAQ